MKKIKVFSAAIALAIIGCAVLGGKPAFAATKTWTGGGADNNLSTAGNWGGVAPVAGDDLVFPITVSKLTITNDMTASTSFNSITFSGAASTIGTGYTISGNAISLVGGITDSITGGKFAHNYFNVPIAFTGAQTISVSGDNTLDLGGVLSGSGNLTINGGATLQNAVILRGVNTFTGTVTTSVSLDLTTTTGLGASSAGTTISAGGQVNYQLSSGNNTTATIAEPFTINTGTFGTSAVLSAAGDCGGSLCANGSFTLSGAIALGADITVDTPGTLTLTGALSGAHTITLSSASTGALVINSSSNTSNTPNGSWGSGVATTTTYAGNQPSQNISVSNLNTAVVTGTYGNVTVLSGGELKGTGTLSSINIQSGGIVAPGMSPGCLTTSSLTMAGTYQAELGGTAPCTGYDQIIVTGSTVDVTGGTLAVSLYNGFKPTKGETFTIINNQGTSPVTGTFTNLAEGATFSLGGYVFRISYVGGDGNDVVLTTLSVPTTPNTGAYLLMTNPIIAIGAGICAGAALFMLVKRKLAQK